MCLTSSNLFYLVLQKRNHWSFFTDILDFQSVLFVLFQNFHKIKFLLLLHTQIFVLKFFFATICNRESDVILSTVKVRKKWFFIELNIWSFSLNFFLFSLYYCPRSPFFALESLSWGQKRLCQHFLGFWLRSPHMELSRPRLELGHWPMVLPYGLWGHFCCQLE